MNRHACTLDEIDAVAAEWVARRDAGLELHEQAELDRWAAASVLHAEALARFEMTWTALGRPRRTGASEELAGELGAIARRHRRRLAAVTASCAVIFAAGATWWSQRTATVSGPVMAQSRTVVHEPARQTLPDGSVVERAPGAELTVAYSEDFRRVRLTRGEAHFSVTKDSRRPFIVSAGGVEVRAVGTAFSVQLGRNEVGVLVTEGRVSVDKAPLAGVTAAIAPEPLAFVDAGKSLVIEIALQPVAAPAVQIVAPEQIAERLAWLNPRVEFSGAPLSEVVTLLNRYNRTKLVIAEADLEKVPLSGLFRADDIETFTRMLETGFGIAVERRGGEIVLRKAR
ncbi:MAG: hypothetical protein EXS32_06560 [Opitutus sp.]|nr:hypothetical protein [Opitutus sp.]